MSALYGVVLFLHSWLRWAVLVLGLVVVVRGFSVGRQGRTATDVDRKLSLAFMASLDTQLLLGLLLYGVLSPITTQLIFPRFGEAMRDRMLRFWAVEHLTTGLLAVILLHVIRVRAKRAPDATQRFRREAGGALVALVLILLAIPWPFLAAGRPLFRF